MNIFPFIKGLTPAELKVISPAFRQKKGKSRVSSPEKDFFQLVLDSPLSELNDELVFKKLGRWENTSAYFKAKSRVFYKILERISTEEFAVNDEILDSFDRAEVRVKKKLYQIKLLWLKRSKVNSETFFHLLDEIIEESKEYELFENLVEALKYKSLLLANRLGYKEYLRLKEEVSY